MISAVKPKKLKLMKSFTPPQQDDGDEFYPNGIFIFNITKLLSFIRDNPERFSVEEIAVREHAIWDKTCLDEATIKKADIQNPILLAEISPGRFNVVDGNHRLERAKRDSVEKIPAYRVTVDDHIAFLNSEKAYRAYVEYWNSKVDEWEA